jgi:hypothetical protein
LFSGGCYGVFCQGGPLNRSNMLFQTIARFSQEEGPQQTNYAKPQIMRPQAGPPPQAARSASWSYP